MRRTAAGGASELPEIYQGIIARAPEHDIDPTLDRVARVLDLLGSPQKAYRIVHVTGTNGKTSTARMVDELVREHGLRTGRFTSPHLSSVTERIAIDGEPISDEAFVATYRDVEPYLTMVDQESLAAGGPRLSFFEVLTVMAFAAFADAPVEVAVVEVGMGGRWDSTNVADAQVAVLAPIAVDHTRWLGNTVGEIAHEKAGIIKPGSTVVTAAQVPDAAAEIALRASEVGVPVLAEGIDFAVAQRTVAVGGQLLSLQTPAALYQDIFLPLHGEHQARNALLALVAAEALLAGGSALSAEVVEIAFGNVTSPGRLEVLRTSPTVLVDAAHNPAGAEALVGALEESFGFRRLVGVVGVMADKDIEGVLSVLEPSFAQLVVTTVASDRSADVDDLAEIAREVFGEDRVVVAEDLAEALDAAVTLAETDEDPGVGLGAGVVVLGSVVLAAQARSLLARPKGR